jgi:hypothetical protein
MKGLIGFTSSMGEPTYDALGPRAGAGGGVGFKAQVMSEPHG